MNLMVLAPLLTLAIPPAFQHGDWIAGCDNHRYCQAIALPRPDRGTDENPTPDWTVSIARQGEADAPLSVEMEEMFGQGSEGLPVTTLRVDGRAVPNAIDKDGLRADPAVIRAIANARKAELVDVNGKLIGEIPTDGAAAVLRWIDAQQRRDGTVTALVAMGTKPASAVPALPPLPRIAVPIAPKIAPPKVSAAWWRALQKHDEICDAERAGGELFRLDAATSVAVAGCMMGAYQGASLVFVVDNRGKARPAPIEWPKESERSAADAIFITEATYDPETHLLSSGAKGRGLGDCFQFASWAWDGKAFRLASYALLDECRGALGGSALPRWQTANDPRGSR